MNAAHAFSAARPLAKHDRALLRAGPGPDELVPALARAAERLGRALRPMLAALTGGKIPAVRVLDPEECEAVDLPGFIAPLAGNALMTAGAQDAPLLISIEAGAVFGFVDRAFGGNGTLPDILPGEFPLSAELLAVRIEDMVAAALAAALGEEQGAIRPLRRDGSLAQLSPFPAETRLVRITLEVNEDGRAPWAVTLAVPLATLSGLFGHGEYVPVRRPAAAPADPGKGAFGELPLSVRAVMAEMNLAIAAVSNLAVGQVLPLPMARVVPLRVDDRTVAHGTVGALDDRVAIQITRIP